MSKDSSFLEYFLDLCHGVNFEASSYEEQTRYRYSPYSRRWADLFDYLGKVKED